MKLRSNNLILNGKIKKKSILKKPKTKPKSNQANF